MLWRRRAADRPAEAAAAAPARPISGIDLMRQVASEIRATRQDVREVAAGVLALIRQEALDLYYTSSEIDEWIVEWARIGAIDLAAIDFALVRQSIKCQGGVRFFETRIKRDPAYATIRTRLMRRLGRIPEKVWLYYVAATPEIVDAVPSAPVRAGAGPPPAARATPQGDRGPASSSSDGDRSRRQAVRQREGVDGREPMESSRRAA